MDIKISAVIITKNEEKNLPECLASVSWVDEVVVVDDQSIDRTVEIAKAAGCKVIVHPMQSYPHQRTLGMNLCSHNWILWIDADERISVSLREEIRSRLESDQGRYTGYSTLYQEFLFWRRIRWSEWSPTYHWFMGRHIKITRKDKWRFRQDQTVHEVLEGEGSVGRLYHPIHHVNSNPDIRTRLQKTLRYAELQAEMEFQRGRRVRWYDFGLRPLMSFGKSFVYFRGFLEGISGWIIAWCSAMTEVCFCCYLYEKQQDHLALASRRSEAEKLWRIS